MTLKKVRDSICSYESALIAVEDDLQEARDRLQEAESKAQQVRANVEELESLANQLIARLPEARAIGFTKRIFQERASASQVDARGGPIYNNVIELFEQDKKKEWTAPAVHDALSAQGESIQPKAIHNVINYLYRTGRLQRVSRGRYMIPGYGFGIMSGHDFEDVD